MSAPRTPLSLLDPVPFARIDAETLRKAIVFAFATGDVGDTFESAVGNMKLAPSTWDPTDFAGDVFLSEVVRRCMRIEIAGTSHVPGAFLLRVLGSPPADLAVVPFRHRVLRELLASPGLREDAAALYARLVHLRDLLSRSGLGVHLEANRRRIDVLRTLVEIAAVAARFDGAESALSRIGTWGRLFTESADHARIAELLAYEDAASELEVRVRLGFDGRIRSLRVVGRVEATDNAFHRSAAGRIATKVSLALRGESFGDEELLSRMLDDVFTGIDDWLIDAFPLLGDLEVYLATLAFRDVATKAGLETCLPTFASGDGRSLEGLFNPLLVGEGRSVVVCNLHTNRDDSMVLITGPNSGGKTRLLQSVALAQVFAQAGLFVPARAASLPPAEGLFVSLIEHARADQTEGRLGTELLRIRRLFERLRPHSLVLLDELCSGTNPDEGEEIFRLVIRVLGELHPATFVTTHFLAFAAKLAADTPSLEALQVELGPDGAATFRFVPGVATSSHARATASRLGVSEDELLALVRVRASR